MNILWLTWKDCQNPEAGGAEFVNEAVAEELAANGHSIIFLVAGWKNCEQKAERRGFKIIRLGNRYSVYFFAYLYYLKNLVGWANVIFDECNTLPFFAMFYAKCKTIFIIQQYAREIWFHQIPFPISFIGYLLEPLYLRLFRDQITITFAQSTKNDLIKYGFSSSKFFISSEVFRMDTLENLNESTKSINPTILFFSALREMKRAHHVLKAFEIAKK